tara:strand:- start:408 stop:1376 length:969 start_codon:yes stop_codon:yes gene_type:complete
VIISKTPYRIPLSGGGTDIDFYYKKKGADFSSVAINQYVYVLIVKRNIENNYLIQTTETQFTNKVDEIKNKLIKETLKFYKIKDKLQISTFSTVPTQTGLGTSSSMVIGLINCLINLKGLKKSNLQIIKDAYQIERKICKISGGWQDQIASQIGGYIRVKISKKEKIKISQEKITKKIEKLIKNNFLLVYSNVKRKSTIIIDSQKKNISKYEYYDEIKGLNIPIKENFCSGNFKQLGKFFKKHWLIKKNLSNKITNKKIDKLYSILNNNLNIHGCKLIGAGGGGFFLVVTNKKKDLLKKLKFLKISHIDFLIEKNGSIIIKN